MMEFLKDFKKANQTVTLLHEIFEKKELHNQIFITFQYLSHHILWANQGLQVLINNPELDKLVGLLKQS